MIWEYIPEDSVKLGEAVTLVSQSRSIPIDEARNQIRTALATGELEAFISDEYGKETDIPDFLWRGSEGMVAFNFGRMQFSVGEHWTNAVDGQVYLDRDDLNEWIEGRASPAIDANDRTTSSAFGEHIPEGVHPGAYKWWLGRALAEQAQGRKIKKTAEFSVCIKEVGCTHRAAHAAFKALPEEFIRKKGSRDR